MEQNLEKGNSTPPPGMTKFEKITLWILGTLPYVVMIIFIVIDMVTGYRFSILRLSLFLILLVIFFAYLKLTTRKYEKIYFEQQKERDN
jgi:hypothetical protein